MGPKLIIPKKYYGGYWGVLLFISGRFSMRFQKNTNRMGDFQKNTKCLCGLEI